MCTNVQKLKRGNFINFITTECSWNGDKINYAIVLVDVNANLERELQKTGNEIWEWARGTKVRK